MKQLTVLATAVTQVTSWSYVSGSNTAQTDCSHKQWIAQQLRLLCQIQRHQLAQDMNLW
jgi:hypothetical protein